MISMAKLFFFCVSAIVSLFLSLAATPREQASPVLAVLDKNGVPITQMIDGDAIALQIRLANAAGQSTPVSFTLVPDNLAIGQCTIAKGSDTCRTETLPGLGWFWGKNGQAQTNRTVRANSTVTSLDVQAPIRVAPRPVVFVHGFSSSAEAWANYLGSKGYLASMGLSGFAVGDGQAPGKLNMGDLANPSGKTETIQANAEILRDYIAGVKKTTGAQMVDLVAHSMGNLVSRYYIDRLMPERDVAQFIMLGPPNQGTDCSVLPASLGLYLPAVLELRPAYVRTIFNPQITHRHGVPFTIIAGTPIDDQIKSPCTAVPSDIAIALDSASGISAPLKQTDVWHSDLNTSERLFSELVKPLLQKTVGEFPDEPDPATGPPPTGDLQFTRVIAGHVEAGSSTTQTINIDNVAVASFALFDVTRSLTVTVRGASGNVIALDPTRNGLVVVQDPATLVYLGYGFANPRPGPWKITLQATASTPAGGADYAITAHLQGGAVLKAQASKLFPKPNEPVELTARLELAGQALTIRDAQARVRYPSGELHTLALATTGGDWKANWQSASPGLYGVDLVVNGNAPDGAPVERSAFLALEVQPTPEQFQTTQILVGAGLAALVAAGTALGVWRRRKKGNSSMPGDSR
jgi:pimeloyl-ACP methyl ester carboxylesterase